MFTLLYRNNRLAKMSRLLSEYYNTKQQNVYKMQPISLITPVSRI